MKSLAVRVLSDFGVDGVEPQAFGSRKARLVLQLLAIAGGQAVPAGVLTDALWGNVPPVRPEDQLAVLISRLRSVLGRDRIEHRDHGYLLHCDWLDAIELAMLTREVETRQKTGHVMGAVAAARVALSLIRGEGPQPLPGEWAQLRLAELERLVSRARLVAATALLEAGDWMAAVDAASAAVERDPYDESALRVLLRAYVMGGRVAGALAAYSAARERMADDLGIDPSPDAVVRLEALERSTDGFELADVDLELRGEGTILGTRQKGRSDLKLASLRRGDRPLVEAARRVAEALLDGDPVLAGKPQLADEARLFVGEDEAPYLFKS